MRSLTVLLVGMFILAACRSAAEPPLPTQGAVAKPSVWMMPPSYDKGRHFRDLFEQPDAWRQTRAAIDVLAFSLIYWASGYPGLERRGLADDSTWYVSVMQQAYDYAAVDGSPDQYVVESWINAPSRSVPETDEFTFTRSVRDFSRKFAKRGGEAQSRSSRQPIRPGVSSSDSRG